MDRHVPTRSEGKRGMTYIEQQLALLESPLPLKTDEQTIADSITKWGQIDALDVLELPTLENILL